MEVFFKSCKWVVILDVVLGELLDDDKHEQVEHDMRDDEDEGHEEECRETASTSLTLDTV